MIVLCVWRRVRCNRENDVVSACQAQRVSGVSSPAISLSQTRSGTPLFRRVKVTFLFCELFSHSHFWYIVKHTVWHTQGVRHMKGLNGREEKNRMLGNPSGTHTETGKERTCVSVCDTCILVRVFHLLCRVLFRGTVVFAFSRRRGCPGSARAPRW